MRVETPWKRSDTDAPISVWVHKAVAARFLSACKLADERSPWKPKRIDSFNDRNIRGSMVRSQHAFALAWDFFDKPFGQQVDVWGERNAPDEAFCRAFEVFGFTCGRRWKVRKDFPHIEWSGPLPTS